MRGGWVAIDDVYREVFSLELIIRYGSNNPTEGK